MFLHTYTRSSPYSCWIILQEKNEMGSFSKARARQLRQLFDEVGDLAPEERAAFLDQTCARDSDLRKEIESLLSADTDIDDVFQALDQPGAVDPDRLIGRTFSHYRIGEKLGSGSTGIVYKARDTKLHRPVALKFLPQQWGHHAAARQRFEREAQAASALDHPNISTIHEIGETDDGLLFIAMAYYEGQTLKKKLERGALPVEEAVDFARQMAQGLGRAHEAGFVHRDIKPADVMVTDHGVVKILGFGLAKMADVPLTKTGTLVEKVPYMSPEQVRGISADFRTDLWSLGVVLYEMLTGQRPFQGDSDQAIVDAIL